MPVSEYDLWADYYDLVHTGLPGEAEFYVGQAVRTEGKTLELGSGTGRICLAMALSGVDVTGLDHSQAMLGRSREKKRLLGKTPGRLRLIQGDMRAFSLHHKFDLIVMPYRTFMHLLTRDDQRSCLNCVYEHLRPGGLFIANLWAADAANLAAYRQRASRGLAFAGRYPLPDGTGDLVHYAAIWCEEAHQTMEEEHLLHTTDTHGAVLGTTALPMRRAWITPDQMRALFEEARFTIDAVFGDFECNLYTGESSEMIWLARR